MEYKGSTIAQRVVGGRIGEGKLSEAIQWRALRAASNSSKASWSETPVEHAVVRKGEGKRRDEPEIGRAHV